MAEYIDREKLLEELKESAKYHAGNSREESLLYRDRTIIREQPTADVIERKKIDTAIKEMEKLAAHKVRLISFEQSMAIDICIDILKRYTGEKP